ncbi:MAG: hypothetical protein K6G87_00570 [Butyrivibrio sp.]|uniref:hypothetical protein n=1 Tax=Butyrivibrio sp. TaxID=28121 RepID=UPI0025CD641F|nr:hypothetical protein [Butyrivibrio sp.]MCR5769704.1 hypothetical protein [Butyrivibrio sp.]
MITRNVKYSKDDANISEIDSFLDSYYDTIGRAYACKAVKDINNGKKYSSSNPLDRQSNLADSMNNMKSIALYLAEAPDNPRHQLRVDYLSNKFIRALNDACESFNLPNYVVVEGDDLENDRIIVFDKPDYSDCDSEDKEFYESMDEYSYEAWKAGNPRYDEGFSDDYDFNCEQLEDEHDIVVEYKKRGIDPFEFCFSPETESTRVGRYSYATRGLR